MMTQGNMLTLNRRKIVSDNIKDTTPKWSDDTNKMVKKIRPEWCPHKDCEYLRQSQDKTCVGRLPKPVPHGKGSNTHRWCLEGAADDGGVFDLQIHTGDIFAFNVLFEKIRIDARKDKDDAMRCKCGFKFTGPGEFRNCKAFLTKEGRSGIICPECKSAYVNGEEVRLDVDKSKL